MKNWDDAKRKRGRLVELQNGRAAMFGVIGFVMAYKYPGTIPALGFFPHYEGELPGVDNYKYRYYITGKVGDLNTLPSTPMPDSEELYYPYTIRCYRGCTLSSGISDFKSCADTTTGATDGFTSAHTVVDGPGLDGYTTPLAVQCLDGDSYTDYDFTEAVITPVDTAGDGGTTGETGAVTTESDAAATRAPRQFAVAGAAALVAAIA